MNRIIIALLFLSVVASAQVNISPNMGMPVPVPGQTIGPDWAQDINASLSIIDSHNHSSGQGVQIQPNGININADLPFSSNNATQLRSSIYTPQVSPLTTPVDIGSLYVVGNELYYNDVTGGNQIQITNNGTVNAGAGSISGLPSGTASASYSAGTFVWQSATSTAANMDARSYILRNSSAGSKGLTLNPPAAMAADITETLPTIPAATKIMQMDSSGNMAAAVDVDNSTLQWISNTLSVAPGGITNTNLAANSVATSNIQDGAVTLAKLASAVLQWNIQVLSANGSFVVPSNVNAVYVTVIGGGGGGGSGDRVGGSSGTGGGGGGGSVPVSQVLSVTSGETLTVTVGSGGAGGAQQNTSGSPGNVGVAGMSSSVFRGTLKLLQSNGGLAGTANASTPAASAWGPSLQSVAGGKGGINVDGIAGDSNFYAQGGALGPQNGTTRGGGGGGGAGLADGGIGAGFQTYTFTVPSSTIAAGTRYSNNGQTFYVKYGSSASTSLLCTGTGNPTASGTLTFVSGSPSGNLAYSAFATSSISANKAGNAGTLGSGGGGGVGGDTSGNVGGAGGAGGNGQVTFYWLGHP